MKVSMLLGGLFYLLRGVLLISPFLILGELSYLTGGKLSLSVASLASQEPIWILAVAAIVIAFIEEHYFREREYEAFTLSLIGTGLVFLIAIFAYTSYDEAQKLAAFAILFLGILDFILGLEWHKPGHVGRKKARHKPEKDDDA